MTTLPSGTVTFLLTDIEQYSMAMERFGRDMVQAVARHNDIIGEQVRNHGGVVHRRGASGDGVFVVFDSAVKAVACALDIQAVFAAEAWSIPQPIRVRMALHSGDVELFADDYLSPVANRCARLRDISHGGQVVVTRATQDLVKDRLPPDTTLLPLGRHHLRGLTEPEEIFQVCHPRLPRDFPPLQSVDALPNNLPLPLTSFVGRHAEVSQLWSLLDRTRILSLVGEGGCGKTRLALEVAADHLAQFADGVWFVDLSEVVDPVEVPRAVAVVLKVREESGHPLGDAIATAIGNRAELLVLDNCEHLVDPAAHLVEELLRKCPKLKILTTSRERLRCRGEMVYRVPALGLPSGIALAAEQVDDHDATKLFVARAGYSDPTFTVSDATASAIASICRQVDGNALAIELAAANVGIRTLSDIDLDLFALLDEGPRTAPRHQRSATASVAWSYGLLTEPQRALFRRLAVFSGGWTLEAAVEVAGDAGLVPAVVPHILTELLSKSMVFRRELADGSVRYGMHGVVHHFAWRELEARGEAARYQARHAETFQHLAETAEPELRGRQQAAWLLRLDQEADNLRAGLRTMREQSLVAQGLRMGASLWRYWYSRGQLAEGREHLERALALAGPDTDSDLRANALHGLGTLRIYYGDLDGAEEALEAALALRRASGDRSAARYSLNNLGGLAYQRGDYPRSMELYAEAAELNRHMDDRWALAVNLHNYAGTAMILGDLAAAEQTTEEGLALAGAIGDPHTEAALWIIQGTIAFDQGRNGLAQDRYRQAMVQYEILGDRGGTAQARRLLGVVALEEGDIEEAEAWLMASLDIAKSDGMASQIAQLCVHLADLGMDRGRLDETSEWITRGRSLTDKASNHARADLEDADGWLALARAETAAAEAHFRAGGALRIQIGNPIRIAVTLDGLAAVASARNELERAFHRLAAADAIRHKCGVPRLRRHRESLTALETRARATLDPDTLAAIESEARELSWAAVLELVSGQHGE